MSFEEILTLVSGGMCIIALILAMVSAMESNGKKNLKVVCTQIVSVTFSLIMFCFLGKITSYGKYGILCYLVAFLVVVLMTIGFYKAGRANWATDNILVIAFLIGFMLCCSQLTFDKVMKENPDVIAEEVILEEAISEETATISEENAISEETTTISEENTSLEETTMISVENAVLENFKFEQ